LPHRQGMGPGLKLKYGSVLPTIGRMKLSAVPEPLVVGPFEI
jgi:hypothetical protein